MEKPTRRLGAKGAFVFFALFLLLGLNVPAFSGETQGQGAAEYRFAFLGDPSGAALATNLEHALQNTEHRFYNDSQKNCILKCSDFSFWLERWTKDLDARNIDIVVLFLGYNDATKPFGNDKAINDYRENWGKLLGTLHERKIMTFVFALPPLPDDEKRNQNISVANTILQEEAKKTFTTFIPMTDVFSGITDPLFLSYTLPNTQKTLKIRTEDGLSFTPAGADIFTQKVLALFRERTTKTQLPALATPPKPLYP